MAMVLLVRGDGDGDGHSARSVPSPRGLEKPSRRSRTQHACSMLRLSMLMDERLTGTDITTQRVDSECHRYLVRVEIVSGPVVPIAPRAAATTLLGVVERSSN